MEEQIRLTSDYSGQILIQEELVKLKTSKKKLHFAASNKRIFVLDLRNLQPLFSYGKSLASQKRLTFTAASSVENISRERKVLGKAKFGMKINNIYNEEAGSLVDLKLFTSDALILDQFLTAFSHLCFTSTDRFLYEGHDESTRVPLLIKAKSADQLLQKQKQNNQMLQIGLNFDGFLARVLSASNPEKEECGEIKEEISFMGSEQEEITEAMEEEYEESPYSSIMKRKKKNKYGSGYLVTYSQIQKRENRSQSKESSSRRLNEKSLFLKQRSKSERALRLNLEDMEVEPFLSPQNNVIQPSAKRRYMMVDSITKTKMEKHLPDTEPIFDQQD